MNVQINRKTFQFKALTLLQKACSKDETRFFITKIFYDKKEDNLVATDGRRLALMPEASKQIPELASVETDQQLQFLKDTLIYDRWKSGQFPNYHRVIPEYKSTDRLGKIDIVKKHAGLNAGRIIYAAGVPLDVDYLKDIPDGEWAIYGTKEHRHAVLFEGPEGFKYIVMPEKPLEGLT